jgi:hypothetical protein
VSVADALAESGAFILILSIFLWIITALLWELREWSRWVILIPAAMLTPLGCVMIFVSIWMKVE